MIVVVGSHNGSTVNKVCWELDVSLQFINLCQIPELCFRFGVHVCESPQGFVLTGGEKCVLCFMFDLSTKSWKQLDSLNFARHAHGSIFAHGIIFVFGGTTSSSRSASVHSLALDGGKWTEEPDMPIIVRYPEVTSVENSIFLLDIDTNQLLKMDAKKKTWSHQKKMPGERCWGARMVSTHNKLFVAGGSRASKICAQYDPRTDSWCSLNSPTLKHNYGALVPLEQKVYLIGGEGEDHIEEYNLDSKIWAVCAEKVPEKLTNLHALVLGF